MKERKQHKHNFVYSIRNKENNMQYIGSKTSDSEISETFGFGINYLSSMANIQGDEFRKDQRENPSKFEYKIISDFDNYRDMLQLECDLHKKYDVDKNPMFYNRAKQTSTGFTTCNNHRKFTPEEIERRRKTMREHNPMKGRKHRPESIAKMIKSRTGLKRSEETKKKMAEIRRKVVEREKELGIVHTPWNKGLKMSEEFCERMKEARKHIDMSGENNPMYGVKRKTKICEHCGKEVSDLCYCKWHGDLCKQNPEFEKFKDKRQKPWNKGRSATEGEKQHLLEMMKKSSWQELKTCPYCGKQANAGNYKQHHGENCKYKPKDLDRLQVSAETAEEQDC